jgi:hypothetical protein
MSVPESICRDSPIANTRTWEPVLWRPIQYPGLGAPKDLLWHPRRGHEKATGIVSRTYRALCVSALLLTSKWFSNQVVSLTPPPSRPKKSSPPGAFPVAGSRPVRATLKRCAPTTSVFPTCAPGIPFAYLYNPTPWVLGDARNDRNCASHADRRRAARRTHARAGRSCLCDRLRHHLPIPVPCSRAWWTGAERALGGDGGGPRGVPVARSGWLSEPVRL